jgi:hypothetical protein
MTNQSTQENQTVSERQEALVAKLEEALSGETLNLLQSAEARYVAAVTATIAPTTVTTTTTT